MAAWRYDLYLLVLKNISLVRFKTRRQMSYIHATMYYPLDIWQLVVTGNYEEKDAQIIRVISWHSPLRGGEGTPLFNVHVKEILQKLSLVKCLYQCSQLHPVRTPQYSSSSSIQEAMNHLESWAGQNKMALNAKEISISFEFKILLSLTPRIQLSVNIWRNYFEPYIFIEVSKLTEDTSFKLMVWEKLPVLFISISTLL